ncbi:MAG: acyl-CoA thioesterase [Cellvibrionaceae bacterium]
MTDLPDLLKLLQAEKIADNTFLGHSQDLGSGRVYGGQVLAQAIHSAQTSVDERKLHSAHAYFLRPGDFTLPIHYSVDATRDGRSYSSRTVTATQKDKTLFTMMCSFQTEEESEFDYSESIDTATFYKKCNVGVNLEDDPSINQSIQSKLLNNQPFLLRFPEENASSAEQLEYFCMKVNSNLPNDINIHRTLLAYMSDFRILASNLRKTGYRFRLDEIMLATICHGIWFHRDFKIDDWLYVICEPLSLSNGRGLSKGSIYNSDGILVATTIQEGVIRKRV